MRIWKWTLEITDQQTLSMPKGSKVLSVQVQANEVQLWALVDERAEVEPRKFAVYGTGNWMPDTPGGYVGTVAPWCSTCLSCPPKGKRCEYNK